MSNLEGSQHVGMSSHAQAVEDPTGREDLAQSLRRALLLQRAAALGASKVADGACADTLAVRAIAEMAKVGFV